MLGQQGRKGVLVAGTAWQRNKVYLSAIATVYIGEQLEVGLDSPRADCEGPAMPRRKPSTSLGADGGK